MARGKDPIDRITEVQAHEQAKILADMAQKSARADKLVEALEKMLLKSGLLEKCHVVEMVGKALVEYKK